MEIKIKKLMPEAIAPTKATGGAAGYDLYTAEDVVIAPWGRTIATTGIAIELPHGYAADVRPRSGFSAKGIEAQHLDGRTDRFNADVVLGLIDEDYRGAVGIIVRSRSHFIFRIPKGTRLAQMVIHKVEDTELTEVSELSDTARASEGFGSTGSKKITKTAKKK